MWISLLGTFRRLHFVLQPRCLVCNSISVRLNVNFDFHRLGVVLNLLRFVIIILGRPAPGAVLACVCHEFQLFCREFGFFTELCCLCCLYSGRECSADADLVPARYYCAGRGGAH